MTARERLGGAIRALRERRGMTGADLARRAGIPRSQQWMVEAGRANPTLDTIDKILGVLGGELRIFTAVRR